MGLSTKQVSGDGVDWGQSLMQSGSALELPKPPPPARRQPPQQPPEKLACPRCGSNNTKFCYYNNYNKSQPRHFCKACKRHWTKGGTLRNVPVGGGRKNKRLKTSTTTTSVAAASATTGRSQGINSHSTPARNNTQMGIQSHQHSQSLLPPLAIGDHKHISEALYQALIPQHDYSINNMANFEKSFRENYDGDFLGSSIPLIQNQTPTLNFSSLTSLENNPSSITASFRSLDAYNFSGGLVSDQSWQVQNTSNEMELPNYWNWEDIDSLVPTHELNIAWDDDDSDHQIKP